MEIRISVTLFLIQYVTVGRVSGDVVEEATNHCKFVEISNTWWHRGLEGVYEMMDREHYSCNNRSVYKQDRDKNMIFFVHQIGWEGWMIGEHECLNKGYLSVTDSAMYLDEVNSTWEEFNSMKWLINADVISGCHIPGVTRPPRLTQPPMKTKPPKYESTTSNYTSVTTPTVSQGHLPFKGYTIVLYVILPIGCIVIIILIMVLCVLSVTQKAFLEKLITPKPDPDKVFFDGNRVTVHNEESSNRDSVIPSLPRIQGDDKDSVYEILTEPEDARRSANATPVPTRAHHDSANLT